MLIDFCGLPDQDKKMKADTNLTVVMWCQIFYRKSAAPIFTGNRRRGRPVDKIMNFENNFLILIGVQYIYFFL